MISRTGTHTLKALVALQQLPIGSFAGAEQLAHQIHAPSNYLGKLLQQIARAGIVEGRKGRKGGFRLAGEGQTFSLFQALDPIEHFDRYNRCLLGRAKCLRTNPCPLHKGWARIRKQYLDFLKSTTLSDLSQNETLDRRPKGGLNDRVERHNEGDVR
jgi:Rrf2 family protein